LFVSLLAATTTLAAWVSVGGDHGASVTVLESTPTHIALEYRVGGFEQTEVTINGKTYSLVSLPGEAERLEAGLPELPSVARSVIIPDDRRMELRVKSVEYTDLHGITPVPSKGNLSRTIDPKQVPFTFDPFYNGSSWYPAEDATQREPYIMRDYRGTTVVATPFRYQPSTGTLRVATRMVVELVDVGPGGANVLVRDRVLTGVNVAFDEIYREHFLNYGARSDKYTMVSETGSMIVICYDAFMPAMQPLIDWRNQSGLPTTMVPISQIGASSSQVKTWIADQYNASTDPKLAFVLLVGDGAQIPTPQSDGGPADPTYGKVVGTDYYPEVIIGRFSAETIGQVETQVTRTVDYEKNPLIAGGDWYGKGIGVASNQGPGDDGEYDYQHVDNIRTKLVNYGYTTVDQIYDPNANTTMVANALNNGRGIANYCGHGSQNAWSSSGFSSSNVAALTNDHMLPFIFSVACVNGLFTPGGCFAEAWLRATHNGVPTGAIATYMASINQSWNPPMAAEDEADDILVQDRGRTFGSLCFNGSCLMIDQYGAGGASMFNTWHIFGDPALRIRTSVPTALNVTAPATILPADATVSVTTDCPGAICGLAFGGVYLGSAIADHNGAADIPVVGTLPDGQNVTLTVTGYNRIPSITELAVGAAAAPLLVLDPLFLEENLEQNGACVDTLHISNQGEAASMLNFSLTFIPAAGANFVTIFPANGQVPFGGTMNMPVYFSSQGLRPGTFAGTIHVQYNGGQVADVPATLHVLEAANVGDGRAVPTSVVLEAVRPNPAAGVAAIRYGLPAAQPVSLVVYDAAGRAVRTLVSGTEVAGYHSVEWNGRDDAGRMAPTGVYFARLDAGGHRATQRMLRVR
jgi:hypothetical protein